MRILRLSERFPPQLGGVAQSAARQVAALAGRLERLDVICLTAELPPGRVVATDDAGATVHRLGRADHEHESRQLLYETARAVGRAGEHQIVHGLDAVQAGYVAVLVARALDVPAVVSLRGDDVDRGMFQGSDSPFLQWTLANTDAITAVSIELLDKALVIAGPRDRLHFVANGVDVDHFTPGEPVAEHLSGLGQPPRPWFGFVGELRFNKGAQALFGLAERLATTNGGTLFAIGGARPDERTNLADWRAREPAASAHLIEVPYEPDHDRLRSFYRAMDLILLPSLWDGMPNAMLEAMACARPVLATRVGGIADVIEDGVTGYLIEPSQLDRLGERVEALMALDSTARAAVGHAASAAVAKRFTVEAERDAILDVYRSLTHPTTVEPM